MLLVDFGCFPRPGIARLLALFEFDEDLGELRGFFADELSSSFSRALLLVLLVAFLYN